MTEKMLTIYFFSFMFSNVYGVPGVERLITLMKDEIIADAGNLGIGDLANIDINAVSHI